MKWAGTSRRCSIQHINWWETNPNAFFRSRKYGEKKKWNLPVIL